MTSTSLQLATLAILERPSSRPSARIDRPAADEHDPYYSRYIEKMPVGDYSDVLRRQAKEVAEFFGGLSRAQSEFAYAAGKWTVTEVLGHLIDTERVFTYRALHMARQDASPLPGFSQDDWMSPAAFRLRTLDEVLSEWLVVRANTLAMAEALPAEAPMRRGTASDRTFSVRALLHIPPGHVAYHLDHLRTHYVGAKSWPA